MENLFAILIFLFLFLLLSEIYEILVKKPKKEELLLCVKREFRASENLHLIFVPLFWLLNLWVFYTRLKKVMPVLYPQYLDKWYQVFNYNLLQGISEDFMDKRMLYESLVVSNYADTGLFNLVESALWMTLTFIYIHDYFQKKGFYNRAVYLGRATLIKWNEISHYEWGEQLSKRNREYRKLSVFINNGKISRWLTDSDTTKVDMLINKEDYEKAEGILRDKMVKCG